ncbi:MAG: hypothetical protein M9905_17980 [Rhizobiaceae bacterium]|nr:hypothetical protein [Rhizobiaceae bacterium]
MSSAYGYSQALDGTWAHISARSPPDRAPQRFRRCRRLRRPVSFEDVARPGVAPNDAYSLYLAHYSGWGGFKNGSWRGNSSLQRYAQETDARRRKYAAQMRDCD